MPIERHVIKHVIKYRQRLYEIAVGLRIVIVIVPKCIPGLQLFVGHSRLAAA